MEPDLVEQVKVMADFLKHVTALSTGSLILLTIFQEKLSRKPRWKLLMVSALCGFALSLMASVFAFMGLLHDLPMLAGNTTFGNKLWQVGGLTTLAGFLIGVVCLTIFGIGNLNTSIESTSPPAAIQE